MFNFLECISILLISNVKWLGDSIRLSPNYMALLNNKKDFIKLECSIDPS